SLSLPTFHATVEGQANVVKGDSLSLLDDSNSYWWLVKVLPSDEIGYIPAENIETPFERLARLNKHRNINLTSSQNNTESDNSISKISTNQVKAVTFASPLFFVAAHEKISDAQLVNEPEEIKHADKQAIHPESNHSMSQDNHRASNNSDRMSNNSDRTSTNSDRTFNNSNRTSNNSDRTSNNSIKVTGSETVELNVKRTDDQQYEQEMNQQNRQNNQQNKQHGQPQSVISQLSDDIRQSSQRSQAYQMKKQSGQLENNLTYDQSARNPNSSNHNLQDVIDNKGETIKVSLTPALGSDFIDFSDEEEEGNRIKSRPGRSLEKVGNDNEPIRTNIAS
ncbi:14937_t:CDS:2, partial [Cetraspora pellucida]